MSKLGLRDATYTDSTPKLHVGDSAFEDWFQQQPFATQSGIKQICRDAYAAGMGDPLVNYAGQSEGVLFLARMSAQNISSSGHAESHYPHVQEAIKQLLV